MELEYGHQQCWTCWWLKPSDVKQDIPVGRNGYIWKTADAGNPHLTRDCCVINVMYFLEQS